MKIFGFALASLASADTFAPTSTSTSASTSASTTVSTSAETGNAFIEITLANVENAGFKGELKVFTGKGCATNPVTGKICDFDYVTSITGLEKIGETYQIHLNQKIDVENDQILMTYRSNDEAVFAGMRVFVDLGGSYIVKDVFKMEGFPQRYFAFDYDKREHPCDSQLPFNTRCTSEAVIDFGTGRLHTGTGLLAGHRSIRNIETGNRAPRSTTQFKIKTGDDFNSGSRSPLNLYYGKSCGKEICQYEKVAEINAERRDQEYSLWMPDFDYNKDQLIMDFRSGDELIVAEMSFNACLKDQCKEFNLLDFGAKNQTILPTFHFANDEHPCNNRQGYGNQTCIYDAVFDFETSTLDFEDTTFVGKTSKQQ